MLDILNYIPAKRKQTPSGWISFNAVCCQHNGSTQDRRGRGGIKVTDHDWSYHCFNCNYTASFQLGRNLSFKARRLLGWMGVPDSEIEHLNLESLKHRNIHGILSERTRVANEISGIHFEEVELPPCSELVTENMKGYWEYIRSRHVPINYPIMTATENDGVHWVRPHVTVPFTYDNKLVGYTVRMLDGKSPKYISNVQPGYVFGTDLQQANWQHVIVVEGIFDALSIDGVAVMHSTVSDSQARLIRNLEREITVVPDQDLAGIELIDRAVELGWAVSIPDWGSGVKDVNDAVVKFGKLATLVSIMQARETSRIKIEMRKKWLTKQLKKS